MSGNRSAPQVKYELLEKNQRNSIKNSYIWTAFCLMILLVCICTITMLTTWKKLKTSSERNDELDFVMFGPKKAIPRGYERISSNRAKMYSLASYRANTSTVWTEPQLKIKTDKVEEISVFKMVCYYSLPTDGTVKEQLLPSMIDPFLCTHINLAFATVINGTMQPAVPTDLQVYSEVVSLKELNPALKVLLSVEWFTSTGEMAAVVSSKLNRTIFIKKAIQLLEDLSLDGLDIDWEFPSWPNEDKNQKENFMLLLKELNQYISEMPRKDKLILTVAVAAPVPIVDQAYDISEMARYIDYINLMTYDFHAYTSYLPVTGANAPLYRLSLEKGYFTTLNTNWSTLYWTEKGMPAEKIIVGFPTYGHSFTLFNEANHDWYAPASGVGKLGSDGFVTYPDVCKFIALEGTVVVFDGENKVPYTYRQKEWISFENEQSIAYKAEFAKWKGYGGVMLFSLNADDFATTCGGKQTFPLARRVKNVIEDDQL